MTEAEMMRMAIAAKASQDQFEDEQIAGWVVYFRGLKAERDANNGLGPDFAWILKMAVDVAWDEVFAPKKQNRPRPARPLSVVRARARRTS